MARRTLNKGNWTEKEKIELFLERVDELRGTKLIANGFRISSKISWDEEEGVKVELPEISDDSLRSLLTIFRHFISDNEPTYMYSIFNLCHRLLSNDSLKSELIEIRKYWKTSLERNGIQLKFNDKELQPEELMSIWVNGWSHHNDLNYRRLLKSLIPYEGAILKAFFLDALVESTKVVLCAGDAIRFAYNRGWLVFENIDRSCSS